MDEEHQDLLFAEVIQSREPEVFICLSTYLLLGKVTNWNEREMAVTDMIARLKQMTGYEFLTRCIVGSGDEINFRERIIPGLLNT
jgi:hypothetical protein